MRNAHLLFSLILSVAAFLASANPTVAVLQTGLVRRADGWYLQREYFCPHSQILTFYF